MKQLKGCLDKIEESFRKSLLSSNQNNVSSRKQLIVRSYSKQKLKTDNLRPVTLSLLRRTEYSLNKDKAKSKSKDVSMKKLLKKPLNQCSSRYPSKSQSHFTSVNSQSHLSSEKPVKYITRTNSSKPKSNREELRKIIDKLKQRESVKSNLQQKDKKNPISKTLQLKRKQPERSMSKSIHLDIQHLFEIKYAYRSQQGVLASNPSKTNQDSLLIKSNFGGDGNHLFAVADGHGVNGHHVSKFAVKTLSKLLQTALKTLEPVQAFKMSFKKTQDLLEHSEIDAQHSGTTLISTLIKKNELYCANVGDSRAIIISANKDNNWQISQLSRDHKPSIPSQKQRILKNGGRVHAFQDQDGNPIGPLRVWLQKQNIQGLAMSRSIGDNVSKAVGVTYQPQIIAYKLKERDKIIVIGSDGLWEFIDNQQAATTILPYYLKGKIEEGIDALVSLAYKRWTVEDDSVVDDITVIVVFLDK